MSYANHDRPPDLEQDLKRLPQVDGGIGNGEEILNLQPKQGKAKAYQVKQVRDVILKYQLGAQDED